MHLCQLKERCSEELGVEKRRGGRELSRQIHGIGAGGGERWEIVIIAECLASVLRAVS